MTHRIGNLIALSAIAASLLPADTVILTNGDRVTGKLVNTADGKLTVKTEFMGDVSISLDGVVSIKTDAPVTVTFDDGAKVTGAVVTAGEQVRVVENEQTKSERKFSALVAVRDEENQRTYEREQERLTNPGWLDFWSVGANLGAATARGNARTTTLTSGALIERKTGFDKTTLTYEQIYSTQSTTEPSGATANAISGSARYERDLDKKLFVYTGAGFDFDEFQDLDLRTVLGGGLGWHILDNDRHKWDFSAGGNWNREKFSTGLVRDSGEINVLEKSEHQLSNALRIHQGFSFSPNMTERGEYRFNARVGADIKLNNHLALTLLVSDKFLSNPLPGNQKNDLLLSTGVQFNWAQK